MNTEVCEPSAKYLAHTKYRQTEVGLIPSDWQTCRMDRCASSVSSGKSKPNNPFGSHPVYGSTGVIGYTDTPEYEGGAILVARVGANAGTLNVVYGKYGVTDNTILLRLHEDIELSFVHRQLESKRLNLMAFGSGQPLITGSQLKALQLVMPRVDEQRAIATALSDVEALIAGLERLYAKKRDIKQAAMQQLLTGQTRLPGFSGEWSDYLLGQLGTTYGGLVGKGKADFGQGTGRYVPFVNVMANVRIDCNALEAVNVADSENQNRVLLGDLLFNGSSETPEEVALCSLMTQAVDRLYLNSFCFGFRLKPDVPTSALFLTYFIRSQLGRELMKSLAQGSTRYNLSKAALLRARLKLPGRDEQTAIATVLSDMDSELSTLEARLAKTRAIKQGMMQELLTGRTRLV
ncbi:MAG: restriction endonuclease subunit S [Hydrogenophaga sp.]|nr:restriction endonuclease subunit S [Hydrogenophaga sp.]